MGESMIRKIEVIFRRTGVYSHGSAYTTFARYNDGQILLSRDYPKGYHMSDIWDTLRNDTVRLFFDNFYPAVIKQTSAPSPPSYAPESPDSALGRQSKHIQRRVTDYPSFYEWNVSERKWHMTKDAYVRNTTALGGGMEIGIAPRIDRAYYDYDYIDNLEKTLSGQTKSFILMIYPDKYDDEVRALYEIKITFW
jgi:hypothetical protein